MIKRDSIGAREKPNKVQYRTNSTSTSLENSVVEIGFFIVSKPAIHKWEGCEELFHAMFFVVVGSSAACYSK